MSSPVTFAVDAEGVGWIVFDDPASRANVFTPLVFAALDAAITALAAQPVRAVVVLSAKERFFAAGADLEWLAQLSDEGAATDFSRLGQRTFQRVADCRVPVICAVHGAAAGGGCELALACHWRICSDAPASRIGLPETRLGVIPAWGGGVRLPRLLGAEVALQHILKGQLLPAADALAAGLVDEVVPAADCRARARAAALRMAAQGVPSRPVHPVPGEAWFAALRKKTATRTRRRQPALLAVIDVVQEGAARENATAFEIEAGHFGQVAASSVGKNMLYAYCLGDAARKRTLLGWFDAGATALAPPQTIGVVGAGVMGSGIAQWCAARGHRVILNDSSQEALQRGLAVVRGLFDEAVNRGKLLPDAAHQAMSGLRSTTELADFAKCDLVIEAIVENLAAKQALFSELSRIVGPDTLLASNTSALPIEEIAGHVPNPARTLGLHFFNPVSRLPLVELIVGRHTSAAAAGQGLAFVKALGKSPAICRSSPGFLVTRVLFFYLNAACQLWERGVSTAAIDRALRAWGWPMGPMRLIDEVGVDVTDFIFGEMAHYFPERFQGAKICRQMLETGLKGRKNGASSGFYSYAGGKELSNPAMTQFAPEGGVSGGAGVRRPRQIHEYLMGVMIDEAKRCLAENVVKTSGEVDFALLSGAGFPAFRGGLLRYAQSIGAFADGQLGST
ncbi:MAG: hypothetical protein EXS39_02665 [Opitutaceae bacterium]|nr:hypothetical protein [Opitutaceae bacterium]